MFKPELFARLQAGSGLAQAWATAHGPHISLNRNYLLSSNTMVTAILW